jgi:lysophospholipase L1-like esterase
LPYPPRARTDDVRSFARGCGLRILTVTLSLLVVFAVLEVALRLTRPDLGWRSFEQVELGWASDEYLTFDPAATPAADGRSRLLFLGDSYLAGSGVRNRDERFPVVLGRIAAAADVQILASGGWGTDQELLAFLQKGAAWGPDLVVLAFCAHNDLRNNLSNKGGRAYKPYFVHEAGRELELFDGHGAPLEFSGRDSSGRVPLRSYAWDLLRFRLQSGADETAEPSPSDETVDPRYRLVTRKREYVDEITRLVPELSGSPQTRLNNISAYVQEDLPHIRYGWELLEGILDRLNAEVTASGAKLIVMLVPDALTGQDARFVTGADFTLRIETPDGPFTLNMSEPRERLRAITARLGIDLFDPTQEFLDRIRTGGLVEVCWPDAEDNHFSGMGHAILAEQLHEYLTANGLLDRP